MVFWFWWFSDHPCVVQNSFLHIFYGMTFKILGGCGGWWSHRRVSAAWAVYWLTESSQRKKGIRLHGFSPQSEVHSVLIEEYMVSSLRRNCLISFPNMRIEVMENVIYDIKRTRQVPKRTEKIKHLQLKILKNYLPKWRPMTDFVHRTIILERLRKSQ